MSDRPLSLCFDRDSEKVFDVEYRLEIVKDGATLLEKTARVAIVTKGDAIAAAVQAKIEALEKVQKNAGDVTFMVANVIYQGEHHS